MEEMLSKKKKNCFNQRLQIILANFALICGNTSYHLYRYTSAERLNTIFTHNIYRRESLAQLILARPPCASGDCHFPLIPLFWNKEFQSAII